VEKMEEDFLGNMKSIAIDLIERLAREELAEDYLDYEAMTLVHPDFNLFNPDFSFF
jgi:hypothetical protein